jgi:hypothetical protein
VRSANPKKIDLSLHRPRPQDAKEGSDEGVTVSKSKSFLSRSFRAVAKPFIDGANVDVHECAISDTKVRRLLAPTDADAMRPLGLAWHSMPAARLAVPGDPHRRAADPGDAPDCRGV